MRGVREIELDLEEICSRSNRVKENVEKMLDKYSPAYLEDKDATDLMLPTSLKEFWVHQQSTSAHVMGKNEQQLEQRKAYSLYGLWEELSARAEAASSQARMVPSKSYMNLTVFRKDPIDAPKLTGFKRILTDPHSEFRLAWSLLALLFVAFDAISIPVMVSWEIPSSALVGALLPMNFYWTIDMFFSAQTGFYQHGLLVQSTRLTLRHYLKTWFFFDLIVVSFDWVMLILEGATPLGASARVLRAFRMIRIIRLLRVAKLQSIVQVAEDVLGSDNTQAFQLVMAVLKALSVILFSVHVLGCFWFLVGRISTENDLDSWLVLYKFQEKPGPEQYLASCHWILGQFTPAPTSIHASNPTERSYNVFVIFFSLLVVGSCISRVSATIQQVIKLNSEVSDRKRSVAMYLKINKISLHLCIRVMRFVDHSLGRHKAAPLDTSLLSSTLINELHMDRRGPILRKHHMYAFLEMLSPKAFTHLCGLLQLTVFEDQEVIFGRYTESRGLYILGPGEYQELGEEENDVIYQSDHTFWSEIALFMNFAHTTTVSSLQFNDVLLLKPTALTQAIQEQPECCSYIYQYARNMQSKLNAQECEAQEVLDLEVIRKCSEGTDVHQLRHLSQDKMITHFVIHGEKPTQEEILSLIHQVLNGSMTRGSEILAELERLFPELHKEVGTHAVFTTEQERHRALSCMICVLWLASDRYDEFTAAQPGKKKLQPEQWQQLQDFVAWTGLKENPQWIHGLLMYLAVKGLGRSKSLALQLPRQSQQPDAAVSHLLEKRPNVVPSSKILDEELFSLVESISLLHESFVFGQFMQAENTPLSLQILRQRAADHDEAAYKLFLVSALAMLAGIGAKPGDTHSPFLTETTTLTVLYSLQALQKLQVRSSQEIYWSYLCHWGRSLALSTTTLEDLAFLRLACICRTRERSALEMAYSSWASLGISERQALTDFLLADGIHFHAVLFSYLPDCFVNAHKNHKVGLASMLVLLVELVEITWTQLGISVLPHQVTIHLGDLAAFTAAVRSRSVFFSCLEHARITVSGSSGYTLSMTNKNWSRTEEVSNHDMSVSSALRSVLRSCGSNCRGICDHLIRKNIDLCREKVEVSRCRGRRELNRKQLAERKTQREKSHKSLISE